MYAWIYRHLPGPTWLRITLVVVLLVALVLLLMEVVFPLAERLMPYSEVSVQ